MLLEKLFLSNMYNLYVQYVFKNFSFCVCEYVISLTWLNDSKHYKEERIHWLLTSYNGNRKYFDGGDIDKPTHSKEILVHY